MVGAEISVLTGDDRPDHIRRDAIDRHRRVMDDLAFRRTLQHQHRRGRVEEEIGERPRHRRQHQRHEENAKRRQQEAVALAPFDAAEIEIEIGLRVAYARAARASFAGKADIGLWFRRAKEAELFAGLAIALMAHEGVVAHRFVKRARRARIGVDRGQGLGQFRRRRRRRRWRRNRNRRRRFGSRFMGLGLGDGGRGLRLDCAFAGLGRGCGRLVGASMRRPPSPVFRRGLFGRAASVLPRLRSCRPLPRHAGILLKRRARRFEALKSGAVKQPPQRPHRHAAHQG